MSIENVCCLGAGLIGHSWATLFSSIGYNVTICDVSREILNNAANNIKFNLNFLAKHKLGNKEKIKTAFSRIRFTTNLEEAIKKADYIQESVVEKLKVKISVFKHLDLKARRDAIIASSSSGLLITNIQKRLKYPERCLIAHPWNPPHLMPLVEIVPGEFTSQDTINEVKAFMMKIGKVPVILKKEIPGYIGNRLSAALWREAINLIDKGVASAEEIDKVVCYSLGIRWAIMGPFLTYHLSGGSGGIRYHFEHLEPTFSLLWKTMNIWTKIPKTIKEKVISEVEQMSMIRSKNIKELTIWRDEKLVNLIKTLNLVDLKKSTKNKIKKGE